MAPAVCVFPDFLWRRDPVWPGAGTTLCDRHGCRASLCACGAPAGPGLGDLGRWLGGAPWAPSNSLRREHLELDDYGPPGEEKQMS